jgi:hypothetical protein
VGSGAARFPILAHGTCGRHIHRGFSPGYEAFQVDLSFFREVAS